MQLLSLILQTTTTVVDSAAKTGADTTATEHASPDILFLMSQGGVVMIFLALCLVISIYFIIERFIYINGRSKIDYNLMNVVRDNLKDNKLESALTYCERTHTAQSQVIATGLRFIGSNVREIESAMEVKANVELSAMESNLNFLSLISRIAPMLGFVGTIWGVINIFYSISVDNNLSIGAISGGLYVKMVTSFAGLLVGILSYIPHQLYLRKIDRFDERLQEQKLNYLELLIKSNI
ncbi:MAG: MotA/TolQ/ExbB proton channel family protein [Bacteroidetes bacterium]|nr:MotA/TolQ/ExbB proton channel family protein [Bacteroidota bacterium]